jgi:hypothetical protein
VTGGIYLIQDSGDLVEMTEQAYDSEALLQELLARYPSLLAGNQLNPSAPRRWLLIAREVRLASEEDGTGRWSVDHVFLDQDAVPTLVEVKRSTDTRIRREVVGQLLDYAANAVVYWPIEQMQANFQRTCERDGRDPEEVLFDSLGIDTAGDEFWQLAKTNLQAGRVRLIFVADTVPPELRRIIEFLNSQMDPAEVIGIEVPQFVGHGMKALVPRVIGLTAEAQQRKTPTIRAAQNWDEASYLEELTARRGVDEAAAVRRVQDWAREQMPRFVYRRSGRYGTFWPCLDHNGIPFFPVAIRTDGTVEIGFRWLMKKPPFEAESRRRELLVRLNQIDGVQLPASSIGAQPKFVLSALTGDAGMRQFLGTLSWFVREVTAAGDPPS